MQAGYATSAPKGLTIRPQAHRAADLREPVLTAMAGAHGATVPQIILRWHLEHGFIAIPKSGDDAHIAENFDIFGFSLDGDEVAKLDSLAD